MYIISTLKANIMYTRVCNVQISPLDVWCRVEHISSTQHTLENIYFIEQNCLTDN